MRLILALMLLCSSGQAVTLLRVACGSTGGEKQKFHRLDVTTV